MRLIRPERLTGDPLRLAPEPGAGPARLDGDGGGRCVAPTQTCSTGAAFYLLGRVTQSATPDNAARRSQTMPMGHRARLLALASLCIFLASLALAACGSATSAGPVSPGFTWYDWQVVAISHDGNVASMPPPLQLALQFSPGGQFGASDSVNFYSGTYRTASEGFTTSVLASTAVGRNRP